MSNCVDDVAAASGHRPHAPSAMHDGEPHYLPLLYASYGSNLHHAGMRRRCPLAKPVGVAMLPGWKLVMRSHADIEPAAGESVPLGFWRITATDLVALDLYEDAPIHLLRGLQTVAGGLQGTSGLCSLRPAYGRRGTLCGTVHARRAAAAQRPASASR